MREDSREARGYGLRHKRARAGWERKVRTGKVACARCKKPIIPGQPWHLDHTDDREGYLGPSHAICNLRASGGSHDRHSREW
jgi:hypothetical protein